MCERGSSRVAHCPLCAGFFHVMMASTGTGYLPPLDVCQKRKIWHQSEGEPSPSYCVDTYEKRRSLRPCREKVRRSSRHGGRMYAGDKACRSGAVIPIWMCGRENYDSSPENCRAQVPWVQILPHPPCQDSSIGRAAAL